MNIRSKSTSTVVVHGGELIWLGEHWINLLARQGERSPCGVVSLFHTHYSPVGEGSVAIVRVHGEGGVHGVCADNRSLADYMAEHLLQGSTGYEAGLPVLDATFARQGDMCRDPGWRIDTNGRRVIARWYVTDRPVVASGTFRAGTRHFTTLFFTDRAEIELDGQAVDGKPYPRDIWQPSIGGGLRSSCVIALGETFVKDAT